MHFNFKIEPVVAKLYVRISERSKAFVGFRVGKFVRNVSEPGSARLEPVDQGQSLLDCLMHWMRGVTKSIQDEHVEILQQRNRRFRHGAEIGEVSCVAEAEAEDRDVPVNERNRGDGGSEQLNWAIDEIDLYERHGAELWLAIEYVGKSIAENLKSFLARKNRECRALPHVEGTNVVEPENVVGVGVGKYDGVEALDAAAQGLLAKIRCRVNDDVVAVAGEKQGRAKAVVARIAGGADTALATERRHAHRSAGAEDRELERIC